MHTNIRISISVLMIIAMSYLAYFYFDYSLIKIAALILYIYVFRLLTTLLRGFLVPGEGIFNSRHYFWGVIFSLFLFGFLLIFRNMDSYEDVNVVTTIILCILAAFLFGFLNKRDYKSLIKDSNILIKKGENMLLKDEAYLEEEGKAFKGLLILTDGGLYFDSSGKVEKSRSFVLDDADIVLNTRFGIPNGLVIDGNTIFQVSFSKLWMKKVQIIRERK